MDTEKITGHLILIMGPTGSGKGSIVKYLHTQFPELQYSVSCTTRQPRPGEIEGKDYYFLTEEVFQKKIDDGDFLEWAEFSGNKYGTLKSELVDRLERGQVVITEIELQGVRQLKNIVPKRNRTLVFIDAGDWEALKTRAMSRAPISEAHLELRRQRYIEEIKSKSSADVIIDNSDGMLKEANRQVVALVQNIILQTKANILNV